MDYLSRVIRYFQCEYSDYPVEQIVWRIPAPVTSGKHRTPAPLIADLPDPLKAIHTFRWCKQINRLIQRHEKKGSPPSVAARSLAKRLKAITGQGMLKPS
jgi:hypothetical protein